MDEPGTVFCLIPQDFDADEVVRYEANRNRRRYDPNNSSKQFLRIGFDQPSKVPGQLVRFGRIPEINDVILGEHWSIADQCYFDFHRTTGELLLHDVSSRSNTVLWDEGIPDQIGKSPRIGVVSLTREWYFSIGCATFRLIPRITQCQQDVEAFTEEKMAFARKPVPKEYEGTYEGTFERLRNCDLQSLASRSTHNTRIRPPRHHKWFEEIKYTQLKQLGDGSQGQVYEVVDMNTGNHYACKVLAVKEDIPEWGIHNEAAFKRKIRDEVDMVLRVNHAHIVPYLHSQGWQMDRPNIEIFMPVYEGSLHALMQKFKSRGRNVPLATIDRMFRQILRALDHVHTLDIIHRDIKPSNILTLGDDFFLADFGIAKQVDTSHTVVGTQWYMAPEVWMNGAQGPKVDIYALCVTIFECLGEFPSQEERAAIWQGWQQWHRHLQTLASEYEHHFKSMLADFADERPTARQLLAISELTYASFQSPQNEITPSGLGLSSTITNHAKETTMIYSAAPTPMELTLMGSTSLFRGNPQSTLRPSSMQILHPNPVAPQSSKASNGARQLVTGRGSVRSANKGQKKRQNSQQSNANGRSAMPQSAGIRKRTLSSRGGRSRPKGVKAKGDKALQVIDITNS